MSQFFKTLDTIDAGLGFALFGALHISWLIVFVIATTVSCLHYRKLSAEGRARWKKAVAVLLLADELFKITVLVATGQYEACYLPLHLCSINIFVVALHAWRSSRLLGNFLYTVCIPGAMAALLFPSWSDLPLWNAMHLHSFTVHIILALYPIVLTVNGEMKPRILDVPKSLGLLVLLVIPIYGMNLLLNTNFMFLMYADKGNPLYWFAENWGSHLWGFPVITAGVILVMYAPLELYSKCRK